MINHRHATAKNTTIEQRQQQGHQEEMTSSVRGVCVKEWDKQQGIYTKYLKIYYILRNIITKYIYRSK